MMLKNTVLLFVIILISCGNNKTNTPIKNKAILNDIIVGANQTEDYLPLLKGKRVGIVANQTSVVFKDKDSAFWVDPETMETGFEKIVYRRTHLVDSLVSLKVNIQTVFAPEHGFRGTADAGEVVKDGVDTKTGLPIISLYGKNKKPTAEQLENLDVIVFDIQDVGARFYTYISSLHYVMEACAENNIPIIILDRPNPNGHFVDGPILEIEHKSFVGMHPIPVAHGMTIGEYAQMINGQGWLEKAAECDLTVIKMDGYSHSNIYSLQIKPSPNLPNDQAINLYPSLCFFEGTNVSAGRGTEMQFQIFGSPFLDQKYFKYEFTPQPNDGSKYPKHEGELCYGLNLQEQDKLSYINLEWLIEAYISTADKSKFFNAFFTKLAGTHKLQKQIEKGYTAKEIRETWFKDIDEFKRIRSKYLLYN
jgi:uncharacterized protein YbbC (DUF1343 family)